MSIEWTLSLCRGKPLRNNYDAAPSHLNPAAAEKVTLHGKASPLSRFADATTSSNPMPPSSLPEASCHITSSKVSISSWLWSRGSNCSTSKWCSAGMPPVIVRICAYAQQFRDKSMAIVSRKHWTKLRHMSLSATSCRRARRIEMSSTSQQWPHPSLALLTDKTRVSHYYTIAFVYFSLPYSSNSSKRLFCFRDLINCIVLHKSSWQGMTA